MRHAVRTSGTASWQRNGVLLVANDALRPSFYTADRRSRASQELLDLGKCAGFGHISRRRPIVVA
jgi:hypothetical protein